MRNVMKSIFDGNMNNDVHDAFVKFGCGRFENRYLLEGKKQKNGWSIKTSAEFVNALVEMCLADVQEPLDVNGIIVYTIDLSNDIKFPIERVKKFMGIKQFVVDTKVEPEKLRELIEKYPRAFYALSFKTNGCELKVKSKAPKSAKPSASGEKEAKPDFCSLKTPDEKIINELFFDFSNFKEIKINHVIEINKIELPVGIDEPVKIREMARRKGRIIRKIVVDGREEIKEKEFVA